MDLYFRLLTRILQKCKELNSARVKGEKLRSGVSAEDVGEEAIRMMYIFKMYIMRILLYRLQTYKIIRIY